MKIVWDEPKRQANLAKHGLDFADLESRFSWDRFVTIGTKPSRTGRARALLIGVLDGDLVVVAAVSPLGSEALSLISLRPASPNERKAYDQA